MASYGKIRETTISGQAGTTWYVELWKKDYTGSVTDLALQGEGFTVNWSGQGGTRDKQFIKSESVLSMYVQNTADEDLIYDIFSKGDRSYYTRIYKNGQTSADIWWFGWVNPSFCTIENTSFPYKTSIKSTDSIGTFSKKEEIVLEASDIATTHRINSHIKDFGDTMGLYNAPTELVLDGNFPDPNANWDIESAWSIPTGGGRIDYDANYNHYIRTNTGVTSGNDYSFAFNISNLTEGGSAKFTLRVYNGLELFSLDIYTYTSNGNYIIKGECLNTSTGIRVMGLTTSDSFSLTNVSLVDGLETNISPCPTNNDWFQTSIDWWRDGDNYQSDDPFYLYRATKTAFRNKPKEKPLKYKEYDVLKGLLKTFNTTCILSEGKYNFIQPNNWLSNTDGVLPFYQYNIGGDNRNTSTENITNLISIDGSTSGNSGVILGGSSLTFEPPIKDVSATFENTFDIIYIPDNVEASTELDLGFLDNSSGPLSIIISGIHRESMLTSEVDVSLTSGYYLKNWLTGIVVDINIKLTNGIDTYYLEFDNLNNTQNTVATWSLINTSTTTSSGYGAWDTEIGGATQYINSPFPCSILRQGSVYNAVCYFLKTLSTENAAPISGDLSITLSSTVTYSKIQENSDYPQAFTKPAIQSSSTTLSSASYFKSLENLQSGSNSVGIEFQSSQDSNVSEESIDLGNITIGALTDNSTATFGNSLSQFNIAYNDANNNDIKFTSDGFRQGGSGDYINITQLLTEEYLKPQVEPLEILQADIFSSNISPLKLLKYSISNDSSFNYYTFLGGKFGAQSETMSGEWYKVSNTSPTIIQEPHNIKFFENPQVNQSEFLISNNAAKANQNLIKDSLGVLDAVVLADTPTTTISLSETLKGELAQNQKLKLTYPDGSNPITITSNEAYNLTASDIVVDSFTSLSGYPIGSIISTSPYETVSLMQRLTTSGNASFRSVGVNNIQEINFLPQDFNFSSSESAYISSIDLGGSAKISNHQAQMLAQKLVSKGKTITKVNVFGSANFSFRVYEGFIFNDTTTLVGTGTVNTELDITDIVGTSRNYITIEIQVSSDTEEVYGGYALVTNT